MDDVPPARQQSSDREKEKNKSDEGMMHRHRSHRTRKQTDV